MEAIGKIGQKILQITRRPSERIRGGEKKERHEKANASSNVRILLGRNRSFAQGRKHR